jgi:hypothetical protein
LRVEWKCDLGNVSHTFFWFEEIDDVSGADLLSNAMLEFFDWGQ